MQIRDDMKVEELKDKLLKKFESSRVVFWYDSAGNFEDDLENLELDNIKICKIENNEFYIKYFIEKEFPNDKILVYHKGSEPQLKDNWLADILLYSEKFYADHKSIIKDELEISFSNFEKLYRAFPNFFKSKQRIGKLKKFHNISENKQKFILAMIAVIINSQSNNIEDILLNVLESDIEDDCNDELAKLAKFDLDKEFWNLIINYFDINNNDLTLTKLISTLIISNIVFSSESKFIFEKLKENLDFNNIEKGLHIANYFVEEWKNNNKFRELYVKFAEHIEYILSIKDIFTDIELKDLVNITALEFFDELIIEKLSEENLESNFEDYLNIINQRKNKFWWDKYKNTYEAIENYLKFNRFLKTMPYFQEDFNYLVKKYAEQYYLVDKFYRNFIYSYKNGNTDILNNLYRDLEIKYREFCQSIYTVWDKIFDYDSINKKQLSFYNEYVRTFDRKKEKVFIVISDALRFEAAKELTDAIMSSSHRSDVKIDYMLANIPTVTHVGMASLLPHNKLELKIDNGVFVDGKPSATTKNKQAILESYSENSVAISESDFMSFTTIQGKEFFKGKHIIYIYQNVIDKIGDDNISEGNVFSAVRECIASIIKIIKKAVSFNGNNILITADHGFIYQDSEIGDHLKIEFPFDNSNNILKPRYSIGKTLSEINNCHFFDKSNEENGYLRDKLLIPKNILRFSSTNGANKKFLHGGLTPQELIIPIVKFKYLKQISKKIVDIDLIYPVKREITSNKPRFQILQLEPISEQITPFEAMVALFDDNNKISNNVMIEFKSDSDRPDDRIYEFKLNLKPMDFDRNKVYKLKIFNNKENILIKEYDFKIKIFISNDFF